MKTEIRICAMCGGEKQILRWTKEGSYVAPCPVCLETKKCSKCEQHKSRQDFPKVGARCKACVAAYHRDRRLRDPEKVRAVEERYRKANQHVARRGWLRRAYGLSPEDFDRMWDEQRGLCLICRDPLRREEVPRGQQASVDHCHRTGKVRGLLHRNCNAALGQLKDNHRIILAAASYLAKHNEGQRISPLAFLGGPPEHREYIAGRIKPLDPGYELGDDVVLSEFVRIHRGIERPTRVGARSLCMSGSHVAHDVWIGTDCEIGANATLCGHVTIGDRVQIGGNAWLKPYVRVGDGARIGGGSVVIRDVPAGEVWAGNPAKPLRSGREAERRGQTGAEISVEEYAEKCWEAVRGDG